MKIKLTGTHLVVNGETVEDGGRCEIGEAEAMALIDRGLAEPDDSPVELAADDAGGDASWPVESLGGDAAEPSADGDRHALIVEAIRDLIEADPERTDEEVWTKSGKPDVKALESLLGFDVSAAERDAAMTEVTGE